MSRFQSSLRDKAGILTSGSSGFGFEMAKALVANGARVAGFSADVVPYNGRREVEAAGSGTAVFQIQDITAPGAADRMVDDTVQRFEGSKPSRPVLPIRSVPR
jgi:NAD(P)-dependent dehydrogenase (short-subunit alcohol dehydrogenase family)